MYVQEIEDRDFELTRYRSLADEHTAWHTVHGWQNGCPLDCAAADPYDDEPASPVDSFFVEVFTSNYCEGNPPF